MSWGHHTGVTKACKDSLIYCNTIQHHGSWDQPRNTGNNWSSYFINNERLMSYSQSRHPVILFECHKLNIALVQRFEIGRRRLQTLADLLSLSMPTPGQPEKIAGLS